ncbi:hypothetical protein NIASO_01530 [Niabella soli DSM 19437]|uniref:Uncharacterized protein n=2 Tax=Niabella TaxID=379899 RepID=W0ETU9_9BACT|nr:hypothetical protein NIASO_01530 [Niabella soli DSM 19437]
MACSGSKKLLPAEALHMDEATTQAYPSRFYDDQTHIRYDFRNDDKNFYVILETDNAASKMRMLREGVKIYFSPSGSKDGARYIQYPYNNGSRPPSQQAASANHPASGELKNSDHNDISFHRQAALNENGKIKVLDMNNSSAFQFTTTTNANGFFRYVAIIPKNALTTTKNNTVIGISIAEMKRGGGSYGAHGTAQTHVSTGGGGMHGGGRGMRGGGGRGGGMHRNDSSDTGARNGGTDASGKVDWWYKVALAQ